MMAPNNFGFHANPGLRPVSRTGRGFGDSGFSPWNSWGYGNWNSWNGYSSAYWNTVLNINTVNPAMNGFWSVPSRPTWNVNPHLFNANFNPAWNNFYVNPMWRTHGVNPLWNNFGINFDWNSYGLGNGLPVGQWNGFNPAMLVPVWGGANPELPR